MQGGILINIFANTEEMYAVVVETFVQGVLQFHPPHFLTIPQKISCFLFFPPSIHSKAVSIFFFPSYMPANHEGYVNKTQLIFSHAL